MTLQYVTTQCRHFPQRTSVGGGHPDGLSPAVGGKAGGHHQRADPGRQIQPQRLQGDGAEAGDLPGRGQSHRERVQHRGSADAHRHQGDKLVYGNHQDWSGLR